ncbi:MAG: hypothetical protein PWQ57_2414 [Desulfovibrionales bacterium]|jgi:hypothetical protein|nr:hypothetical protein [Desulfovibrionales bacterium]
MRVDKLELEQKIKSFYPEIERRGLALSLEFDEEADAWSVVLSSGNHLLTTYIDPEDAENYLSGVDCKDLSRQIERFIETYCCGGTARLV